MLFWAHFGGVFFLISDKIAINEKIYSPFTLLRKKIEGIDSNGTSGRIFSIKNDKI